MNTKILAAILIVLGCALFASVVYAGANEEEAAKAFIGKWSGNASGTGTLMILEVKSVDCENKKASCTLESKGSRYSKGEKGDLVAEFIPEKNTLKFSVDNKADFEFNLKNNILYGIIKGGRGTVQAINMKKEQM